MADTDVVTQADPEDYPHSFGLAEDPPTPDAKESNDDSVVSDEEVAKATGGDDPTALSRPDDVTTESEHWADGHYYQDQTGMTERTEGLPEDNFTTDRESDGTPVMNEGETDDAHADAPPEGEPGTPPPAPDEPPAEAPPAEEPAPKG